MKRLLISVLATLFLSPIAWSQGGPGGSGVEGTGVEGHGVSCERVYGPPCDGVRPFALITESNSTILTEDSMLLVTEGAP